MIYSKYKHDQWHKESYELLCSSCGSNVELYKLNDEIKCNECIGTLEEQEIENYEN